jgi:hypothetical protein
MRLPPDLLLVHLGHQVANKSFEILALRTQQPPDLLLSRPYLHHATAHLPDPNTP